MECQKALEFHQKYLNLCSEDERRSCMFGINNRILFFGVVTLRKCWPIKGPLSIVNNLDIYEARLTQKSLAKPINFLMVSQ